MEMSVVRALRELKLLNDRIHKEVMSIKYADTYQNRLDRTLLTNLTKEEYTRKVKSVFQSVNDLIAYRNNLKKAILMSNSQTFINIADEHLSITEAIERKNSIAYEKLLLNKLKEDFTVCTKTIEEHQAKLDAQIEQHMATNYGADKEVHKDDYEKIAKPLMDALKLNMLDPLNLKNEIEKREKKIDAFESDIDIVLSESNAKTMITI